MVAWSRTSRRGPPGSSEWACELDGLEEAKRARDCDIGGVVGHLEGQRDMALCGEVVDLVGEDVIKHATERRGVIEVGVVEVHRPARLRRLCVWVMLDVVEPPHAPRSPSGTEAPSGSSHPTL